MTDDWRDSANCLDSDPAIFFPEAPHGGAVTRIYQAARAVCAECEVVEECLHTAMLEERNCQTWRSGMRGGMTPSERDRYARRVRYCAHCNGRFAPASKERFCSDECRKGARAQATAEWRERVA